MLGGAGVTSSADLGPAPTRLRPGRIATRSSLEPVLGVEIGSPPHREIVRGSRAPSVGPTAPEGPVGTRRAGRDAEPPDTREARLLGLVAGPASNGAARYEKGPPEPGRSVLTQRGGRRIREGPAPMIHRGGPLASCAPGAIRTRDTRFRRAVLYPLSYEGLRGATLPGERGPLEPGAAERAAGTAPGRVRRRDLRPGPTGCRCCAPTARPRRGCGPAPP